MKNYRYKILFLLLTVIISINSVAQDVNYFVHTVSKGQTLYSISRMYNTTVKEIIEANPECVNKLSIGQKIKIHQNVKSVSAEQADDKKPGNAQRYHTIQPGETLYRLSQKYGVTPQDICAANPGLGISNFRSGEVIMIPSASTESTPAKETVKETKEEDPDTIPIRTFETYVDDVIQQGLNGTCSTCKDTQDVSGYQTGTDADEGVEAQNCQCDYDQQRNYHEYRNTSRYLFQQN